MPGNQLAGTAAAKLLCFHFCFQFPVSISSFHFQFPFHFHFLLFHMPPAPQLSKGQEINFVWLKIVPGRRRCPVEGGACKFEGQIREVLL